MSVPFFAKALFEYSAVEESELSVAAGDFLTVEEVNESGWCLVRAHNHNRRTTASLTARHDSTQHAATRRLESALRKRISSGTDAQACPVLAACHWQTRG